MMTDQELLTYAAKAAGKRIDKSKTNGGGNGNTGFDIMGNAVLDWHNMRTWNPLKSDSDAFRLMVKLHMLDTVRLMELRLEETRKDPTIDDCKILRKSVVRAAAEIGKEM